MRWNHKMKTLSRLCTPNKLKKPSGIAAISTREKSKLREWSYTHSYKKSINLYTLFSDVSTDASVYNLKFGKPSRGTTGDNPLLALYNILSLEMNSVREWRKTNALKFNKFNDNGLRWDIKTGIFRCRWNFLKGNKGGQGGQCQFCL